MFLSLSAIFCLVCAASDVSASVAIGLAGVSAEYPDHCIDEVTGSPHPLDSTWQLANQCGLALCTKRGNTLYVSYEFCGFVQAEPPCKTVGNASLNYPACCPRVVCDNTPATNFPTGSNNIYYHNNINNNVVENQQQVDVADANDNEIDIDEYGMYDEELYMMSSNDNVQYVPFSSTVNSEAGGERSSAYTGADSISAIIANYDEYSQNGNNGHNENFGGESDESGSSSALFDVLTGSGSQQREVQLKNDLFHVVEGKDGVQRYFIKSPSFAAASPPFVQPDAQASNDENDYDWDRLFSSNQK